MRLNMKRYMSLAVCLVLAATVPAAGSTLVVAEFEDFISPLAGNVLSGGGVQTVVAGTVTIQPQNPGRTWGGFGSGIANFEPLFVTTPYPRDGEGFISYNGGNIPSSDRDSVVLTFSEPVAGFGATFFHRRITFFDQLTGVGLPATIQLFSGEQGAGALLGQVSSSGLVDEAFTTVDFVGLLSDERNIRSAVLFGPGPLNGFAVDAYAVTLVPIPEPSTVILAALILTMTGRRRSR